MKLWLLVCLGTLLMSGCTSKPDNVTPVTGFDSERYLGDWYEIARLDHSFEEGLNNVTASYSKLDDGGIRVINRGYNAEEGQWDEAQGKAYFVNEPTTGWLKVSFFGPFYASYIVAELDRQDYQWSLVTGPDKDYLWILSRTRTLPEAVKRQLIEKAAALGYDTEALIFVKHDRDNPALTR